MPARCGGREGTALPPEVAEAAAAAAAAHARGVSSSVTPRRVLQMLPAPEELCMPLCWERELLAELRHAAIIQAAMQQQVRADAMQ